MVRRPGSGGPWETRQVPNEPFLVLSPDALTTLNAADRPTDEAVIDAGRRPPTKRVEELVAAGRTVRVRCDPASEDPTGQAPGDVAGRERPSAPSTPAPELAGTVPVDVAEEVALAAAYAWAGARVFVTRHPERVRRALDMVASIRDERPPAAVRRGLA